VANLLIFKDCFLFFLYEPLPRGLSASGVITRFKKRLSMERQFRKTPRPLNYLIEIHRRERVGVATGLAWTEANGQENMVSFQFPFDGFKEAIPPNCPLLQPLP